MSIKSIPHPQPQHLETSPLILLEVSHSVVLVGNSSDLMHRIRALHALICLSGFAGPCPKAGQSQTTHVTCSHLSGLLAHVATATDVVRALEIRVMEAEEFLVYGTVRSGLSLVGF